MHVYCCFSALGLATPLSRTLTTYTPTDTKTDTDHTHTLTLTHTDKAKDTAMVMDTKTDPYMDSRTQTLYTCS